MQKLFDTVGVAYTFYILGFIYMILILGSAQYIGKTTGRISARGVQAG